MAVLFERSISIVGEGNESVRKFFGYDGKDCDVLFGSYGHREEGFEMDRVQLLK